MRLDEAGREDGVTRSTTVASASFAWHSSSDPTSTMRSSSIATAVAQGLSGFIVMMELAVRICFDMAWD